MPTATFHRLTIDGPGPALATATLPDDGGPLETFGDFDPASIAPDGTEPGTPEWFRALRDWGSNGYLAVEVTGLPKED